MPDAGDRRGLPPRHQAHRECVTPKKQHPVSGIRYPVSGIRYPFPSFSFPAAGAWPPPYCALSQEGLYSEEHRLLIVDTFALNEVGGKRSYERNC